jgi:hypothetical protein
MSTYNNCKVFNTKDFKSKYFIGIEISSMINFDLQICIDTGSGLNLLPRKLFEKFKGRLKDLECSNVTIKGISNMPINADGKFLCTLKFPTGFVKNVVFHVINCEIPPLLGFDFFNHISITLFTFKRKKLILNRIFGNKTFKNEIFYSQNETLPCFNIINCDKIENKLEKIQKMLGVKINPQATKKHQIELCEILIEFKDVFGENSEKLGNFPIQAPILTKENKSIYIKQHAIAAAYKEKVEIELVKMLKMGVIEKCDNPQGWKSPILCVPKKDGSVRVCANFKNTINTVMCDSSDKFQLPDTNILFQEIGKNNNFFSTLDIRSGYWQFSIKNEDKHKTSFQFNNKTYCFKRLPMGLKNSGDIFCRAITGILQDVKNQKNFKSFVADLIIHSDNFDDYLDTLKNIFKTFRSNNVRLNGSKCEFLYEKVKFLGRII